MRDAGGRRWARPWCRLSARQVRVKALALVALVSLAYVPRSYAAEDSPVASELTPRCYSTEERANIARTIIGQDARIKSLEADVGKIQPIPLIVTAVLAIGAGVAIGFGVAKATAPKP